ncbi:MAG: hypothetical protein OEX12_07190, partial [Gammaproteobacteria bacterium]|nr:hypothetical protein [Gammaproteobacteria bacterium]
MFTRIRIQILLKTLLVLSLATPSLTMAVEHLQLLTVLQRINATYPSLKIAEKQIEKSHQEVIVAHSQLGWNMAAQGGLKHDLGFLNTVADTTSLGLSFSKQLESGSSLTIGTNVSNSDTVDSTLGGLGSTIVDPSKALDFDLSYRMPLSKGDDNPLYQFAL